MDFINNGVQLILVALTGIILNLAFVYAMAKNSEKTGMITLVAMEFLQFVIMLVFVLFVIKSEGTARVAYQVGAALFFIVFIIFNCLLYSFYD